MVSDDSFYPKGKIVKFSELKAHKRDYVLIPTEQQNIIVFLNKKWKFIQVALQMFKKMSEDLCCLMLGNAVII